MTSLLQYYNEETKTLSLPYTFNEDLFDIPLGTEKIICIEDYNKYEYSMFDKIIDNLPNSLIDIGCFSHSNIINNIPNFVEYICIYFYNIDEYNKEVLNIPCNIKQIKINDKKKIHFIKKIPFGCIITDFGDNLINI